MKRNRVFIRTVWTIGVSIVLPLVAGLLKDQNGAHLFSTLDQVVIGLCVFFVTTLVAIGVDVAKIAEAREQTEKLEIMTGQTDLRLSNIKKWMRDISSHYERDSNFYFLHFDRELSHLETSLRAASENRELHVYESLMPTTGFLLDVAERKAAGTISLVHRLDEHPNDFDHTAWARTYYRRLEQINSETDATVRRLFIHKDDDELSDATAQNIFLYHKTVGIPFRAITSEKWTSLLQGNSVTAAHNEFGIWDDTVFLSDLTRRDEVSGKYSAESTLVLQFQSVFKSAWDSASVPSIDLKKRRLTLDELFEPND